MTRRKYHARTHARMPLCNASCVLVAGAATTPTQQPLAFWCLAAMCCTEGAPAAARTRSRHCPRRNGDASDCFQRLARLLPGRSSCDRALEACCLIAHSRRVTHRGPAGGRSSCVLANSCGWCNICVFGQIGVEETGSSAQSRLHRRCPSARTRSTLGRVASAGCAIARAGGHAPGSEFADADSRTCTS